MNDCLRHGASTCLNLALDAKRHTPKNKNKKQTKNKKNKQKNKQKEITKKNNPYTFVEKGDNSLQPYINKTIQQIRDILLLYYIRD